MKSPASSAAAAAVLVVATVLLLSTRASGIGLGPLWTYMHVHIMNEFDRHHYPLMVHCKSKNDDMGIHWVGPHGEYAWRFKPTITDETLFWCHVSKHGKEIVYDAYWEDGKDYERMHLDHIRWVAKDDGIY